MAIANYDINRSLKLLVLPGGYAICRTPPTEGIPQVPVGSNEFWSLTQTSDELSLICPERHVPGDIRAEPGWRVLKLDGVFAFTETGILASVLGPLGQAGIGILAISTFDTDYVMVKAERLANAIEVLQEAGHVVVP